MSQNTVYPNSKVRYEILDGLRGVAALNVVVFHLYEAHAASALTRIVNHGYLAVDFFYLLSGFVIGHAYDDRWGKMNWRDFMMIRLIRLHPMVIMGTALGALGFYISAYQMPWLLNSAPHWKILIATLAGFMMIPLSRSMDVHGRGEMYPLNSPAWSLFYEYLANILYAAAVRRMSRQLLCLLVVAAGAVLIFFSVTTRPGCMDGGWSLHNNHPRIGSIRLIYPFFAGLLLFRTGIRVHVKHAFWLCSLLIIAAFAMPRIGGSEHMWKNGLYESLCVVLLFPLIVSLGAGGVLKGNNATRICRFLGEISYPIYITHFPLIYIYTYWVQKNRLSILEACPLSMLVFVTSIAISYACLKLYDEPVRNRLKMLCGAPGCAAANS